MSPCMGAEEWRGGLQEFNPNASQYNADIVELAILQVVSAWQLQAPEYSNTRLYYCKLKI